MTQRRNLHTALALTPEQKTFVDGNNNSAEAIAELQAESSKSKPPRPTLVPLTTRITQATAEALRRAYLEQKLAGRSPDTQQDIVEAAIREWLAENAFLN